MTPIYFKVSIDGDADNDSHVDLTYQQLELIERFAGVPILWEGYGKAIDLSCYEIKLTIDIPLAVLMTKIGYGIKAMNMSDIEKEKVLCIAEDMEKSFNELRGV